MTGFDSISTWRQPQPPMASATRAELIDDIAAQITLLSRGRLRVGIDGLTAAGKTSFGHELAASMRELGRPTLRACLDDFKNPWSHAREHGYDRLSGEGYYRNAYDFAAIRSLLLGPAGRNGSGQVVLCAYDPLTGEDHRAVRVNAPEDAVLIVDSVFAFRPEYNDMWDFRIWLEVTPDLSLARGIARDADREGREQASLLHRDRYHAAATIYLAEVDPQPLADIVIDNRIFTEPRVLND